MPGKKYRWDGKEFKEIDGNYQNTKEKIHIITDSLPAGGLMHPVTGKYMTSKSKFREITKAAGCVEIGNEFPKDRRQWGVPNLKQDVINSIEMLKNRR